MKYCCECGSSVIKKIPENDTFHRYVCEDCQTIHYQNPRIITGCISTWEDKILLCRRAIEPRYGLWTIPAGFMENDETTQQGAARETLEEAQAEVAELQLFGVFNAPHINQVFVMFRGNMVNDHYGATHESLETKLFTEEMIPWDELSFPVVRECLKLYFADKKNHHYPVHFGDVIRNKQNKVTINRYS